MKKLLIGALLTASLSAFEVVPYIGMAMDVSRFEDTNSKLDSNSPLGLFGISAGWKYLDFSINHLSSIPDVGLESRGLNTYGAKLKLPIGNTEFYGGYFGHNRKFDGAYYSNRFSNRIYNLGVKYNYDNDKELFIEYLKSKEKEKVNALMYGFRLNFRDII